MARGKITFGLNPPEPPKKKGRPLVKCYYKGRNLDGSPRGFSHECKGERSYAFKSSFGGKVVEVCEYHFKELMGVEQQLVRHSNPPCTTPT